MRIFIVNQNPESDYDDVDGERYNYPTSIPCGKRISAGDILIFNLAKKAAVKLHIYPNRLTGIAMIDEVVKYEQKDKNGVIKEYAYATYTWHKKFKTPISFNQIGGDPRTNENNSMNQVDSSKEKYIIISLLNHLI